jgi:hypothetical protein
MVVLNKFGRMVAAVIVLVFGPGKFSIDALIKWGVGADRQRTLKRSPYLGASVPASEVKAQN